MCEKKRWITSVYSQESHPEADISWTSSDSDDEKLQSTKRLKKTPHKSWLNLDITPPSENSEIHLSVSLDSPIINEIKLEDQSPVLTQSNSIAESPVISRSHIVRTLKWRKKKTKKSPETPDSEVIIESLTQSSNKEELHISPVNSQSSQYKIEPVLSQNSTEITSGTSSSDPNLFAYYNPPPRKKRFKKGSLASQLQKALNSQSRSTGIWQHEVFLNKLKGIEVKEMSVTFSVKKMWEEYGCLILKCDCNSTDLQTLISSVECTEINSSFLLITGSNNPSNGTFKMGNVYQMFEPFCTKVVDYDCKKTIYVLNASRFIPL